MTAVLLVTNSSLVSRITRSHFASHSTWNTAPYCSLLPLLPLLLLLQVCQQHVLGGSSLLQKRAYRVLSYLASSRPEWLKAHLQQMLELLMLASAVALSPAKRYRMR